MISGRDAAKIIIETEFNDEGLKQIQKALAKIGVEVMSSGEAGKISLRKIEEGANKAAIAIGRLGEESKKTKQKIQEIGSAAKNSGDGVFGIQKLIKGFTDLKKATQDAWQTIRGFVNVAIEQREIDARQFIAIKNNTDARSREGKTVKALAKEYKDYANEREKITGIDNISTQRMQTMLLSMDTVPDLINRVTEAFQDMAAETGQNTEVLLGLWGQLDEAPQEAVNALISAGAKLDRIQIQSMNIEQRRMYVLQQLEAAFGGQAQAMAELSGGIAQAEAAFGALTKSIGEALIKGLQPLIILFTKVAQLFSRLPSLALSAILALGGITTAVIALSGAIALTPVGWVFALGAAIAGLIPLAGKALEGLEDLFGTPQSKIRKLKESTEGLKKKVEELTEEWKAENALLEKLSQLQRGTNAYKDAVRQLIRQNGELAKAGITVASSYDTIRRAVAALDKAEGTARNNKISRTIEDARTNAWRAQNAVEEEKRKQGGIRLNENHPLVIAQNQIADESLKAIVKLEKIKAPERHAWNILIDLFNEHLKERNEIGLGFGAVVDPVMIRARDLLGLRYDQLNPEWTSGQARIVPGSVQEKDLARLIAEVESQKIETQSIDVSPTVIVGNSSKQEEKTKSEYDLQTLRIKGIEDEFERRRAEQKRHYTEEKAAILEASFAESLLEEDLNAQKVAYREAIARLQIKLEEDLAEMKNELTEAEYKTYEAERRNQYKTDSENAEKLFTEKLAQIRKEGISQEKQDRARLVALHELEKQHAKEIAEIKRAENEKLINDQLRILTNTMNLGSNLVEKNWKGAISSGLSLIPGVGASLSGAFTAATTLFGRLFRRKSETEAQKLGKALKKAIEKFDKAFKESDIFANLYGENDQRTLDARAKEENERYETILTTMKLDPNMRLEEIEKFYEAVRDADHTQWRDFRKTQKETIRDFHNNKIKIDIFDGSGVQFSRMTHSREGKEKYANEIKRYFESVYGDEAENVMRAMNLITENGDVNINKWFKDIRKNLTKTNTALLNNIKTLTEQFARSQNATIKKHASGAMNYISELNKQMELGNITLEEFIKLSDEKLQSAIDALEVYKDEEEVQKAITDLFIEQQRIRRKGDREGIDRFRTDESFDSLLGGWENLQRDIEAGRVRAGTHETVALQEQYLRAISAYLREHGAADEEVHEWDVKLANLMEKFFGAGYAGRTGHGITPGLAQHELLEPDFDLDEYLRNHPSIADNMHYAAQAIAPPSVVRAMPIYSANFPQMAAAAQNHINNSYNTTTENSNNNTLTINAAAMVPSQEFVDGLRRLVKKVYGKDLIA
jgi:nicotinamide mononucleotide adenylyltransferase